MAASHDPEDCGACRGGAAFPVPFTMAFQPIVNVETGTVFAQEALVRSPDGGGAAGVLAAVSPKTKYAFDQACRTRAIGLAAGLGLTKTDALLSINFLPNAVYDPATCIRATLSAAEKAQFPLDHIMFEITEAERVDDHAHLRHIVDSYRAMGFKTAIDDFGAGYSGLNLLAQFQPDLVKLDMDLVRMAAKGHVGRTLVGGMVQVCRDLGIEIIAEGIETSEERDVMLDLGITLMQGYFFARPGFECLPSPNEAALLPTASSASGAKTMDAETELRVAV